MDSPKNKTYSKSESNININISSKTNYNKKNIRTNFNNNGNLNRNMFKFIFIIGKGGFGKVWRVKEKKTKELYALKEMSKTKIIDKKSEKSINGEREFLSYLHHPFIVNMHYAFQDNDNLYLVMDLLTGGDLRYHCSRYRSFSEEQTRFFLACIIHSLSYIHKNEVIHRDIKPENLVLDDKGYVRITDFGIAKKNMPDNSSETSGTPGYMCPEVMNGKNHSFPADYFSIGVIGYEFMMGRRPYRGRGRKEIKEQMISYQAKIEEDEMKDGWSTESVDFINGLLKRKVKKRLGSNHGIKELKEHAWMKYYPWKDLNNKSLPAPFIPENIDNFDKKYCESIDEISEETQIRYEEIMLCTHYNTAFDDFYFNKNEIKRNYDFNDEYEEENSLEEEKEDIEEKSNKLESNNDIINDNNNKNEMIENDEKEINNIKEKKDNYIINIKKENENNMQKNNLIKEEINKKIIDNQINNNENLENHIQNKLNNIRLKKKTYNEYLFPKNNSDINLLKKKINNNENNSIINKLNEGKNTVNNFVNIKKISVNCKNTISKINKKNNIYHQNNIGIMKDIKDKNILFSNKFNKINNLNNNIRDNRPIKNIFNINNNEIHNINNNNSNINIYLSINMFNKMLNNHFNNKRKNFDRSNIKDLLNKQKQLMIIENKKKSVDNRLNGGHLINHNYKNKIVFQHNNQLLRSNSVGMLKNKNLNFTKNKGNINNYNKNISSNIFNNSNLRNNNYKPENFNYIK